jgi:hypothetical protein
MQSTNSPKLTEFWWPHPDSFSELTVKDSEDGWELSAPDESEVGDWISYYSSTEELKAQFNEEFIKALMDRVKHYDTKEEING